MKAKIKIIISALVLTILTLPVIQANITKADSGVTGASLEGYVNVHGNSYVNDGKVYITDANVVFEFQGSLSVKKVRLSDPANFDFTVDLDLEEDGTSNIGLAELVATNPSRALYEDFHVIQYTGLDSEGRCVVTGKTQWNIKNSGSAASGVINCPLRVDTKSPTFNSWTVKKSFMGLKGTYLRMEATDPYTTTRRPVSGLQFIKYTFTDPNGTVLQTETATFNEQAKEGYHEWTLYENVIEQIKLRNADLKIEVQDWAGHHVSEEIDSNDIEIEQETFKSKNVFLNTAFFSLLKTIINKLQSIKIQL